MNKSVVSIKGKNYRLVADRVKEFRSSPEYKDHKIVTELLHFDGRHIIVKSSILDGKGQVVSEGVSGEEVGSNHINTTSFVENAQTSSVGRALAFLDERLMGDSLPSADEMNGALKTQELLKGKVEGVLSILKTIDNEDQLKSIWEKNSPIWKKEFGGHYFGMIESHKNDLKKLFKKYDLQTEGNKMVA